MSRCHVTVCEPNFLTLAMTREHRLGATELVVRAALFDLSLFKYCGLGNILSDKAVSAAQHGPQMPCAPALKLVLPSFILSSPF